MKNGGENNKGSFQNVELEGKTERFEDEHWDLEDLKMVRRFIDSKQTSLQ